MANGTATIGNPGGNQVPLVIENGRVQAILSEPLEVIDLAHNEIHESKSFTARFSNAVTNINEQSALAWKYGGTANTTMHVVFTVQAAKNTTAYICEDAVILAGSGGTLTPYSRNRATLGTPSAQTVAATPIVGLSSFNETQAAAGTPKSGTEIDSYVLAGGEGPRSIGAQGFRDAEEWVFGGTVARTYSIVMNAETADDDTHYIRMDWYERDAE